MINDGVIIFILYVHEVLSISIYLPVSNFAVFAFVLALVGEELTAGVKDVLALRSEHANIVN